MQKIAILVLARIRSDALIIAILLAIIKNKKNRIWKRIKVDTIAFVIFGLTTSIVTIIYEIFLAGVNPDQWWKVRILYNIIRLLGVYFLGRLTDKLRERLNCETFRQLILKLLTLTAFNILNFFTFFFEILALLTFKIFYNNRIFFVSLSFANIASVFQKLSEAVVSDKVVVFSVKAISDATSLSLYQIPAYIFSALIMGLDYKVIIFLSLIYLLDNLAFGWLFGYILDKTRAYFSKGKKAY
ncbi:MAG: hypothetical protein ACOYMB_05490 [Patescibacteria group bacterium]